MIISIKKADKIGISDLCQKYSGLYWANNGFRKKSDYSRLMNDWKASLRDFLNYYAFERNVRVLDYIETACDVVDRYVHQNTAIDDNFIKQIEQEYNHGLALKNRSPNSKLNPLSSDKSVLSACRSIEGYNLMNYAFSSISSGDVKSAYYKVREVRGVGPKITSLYLRDIADAFNLDVVNVDDPRMLQPIDTWVYGFVCEFAEKYGLSMPQDYVPDGKSSHWKAAQIMIELAGQCGVRHTALNSAVWIKRSDSAAYLRTE